MSSPPMAPTICRIIQSIAYLWIFKQTYSGHSLAVAGIDRYPRKVTKSMGKKKIARRSKLKPFVKCINYNHVMPTRYQVDLDVKKVSVQIKDEKDEDKEVIVSVDETTLKDPELRMQARKGCKAVFEAGYQAQDKRKSSKATDGVQYFYKKLRF
jgi:large subunit ribosomal protein L27e